MCNMICRPDASEVIIEAKARRVTDRFSVFIAEINEWRFNERLLDDILAHLVISGRFSFLYALFVAICLTIT